MKNANCKVQNEKWKREKVGGKRFEVGGKEVLRCCCCAVLELLSCKISVVVFR